MPVKKSSSVNDGASKFLSELKDRWTLASLYIDSHTYIGATQKVVSGVGAVVERVVSLPMDVHTVMNVCFANLNRASCIDAIPKTECGTKFKLYRGITRVEFDRILDQPVGTLFAVPTEAASTDLIDILRHVLGSHDTESGRLLTSFSSAKDLAYKFASTRYKIGVVAEFEVPVSVVSQFARRGLTVHKEILLPTKYMDLSMISSLEIRRSDELRAAKKREILAVLTYDLDLFTESHHFEGSPLKVCDPRKEAERKALRAYLKANRLLDTIPPFTL